MARFSERLRANMYADWRDDYVDYTQLKRALKRSEKAKKTTTSQALHERWPAMALASSNHSSSESDLEAAPLLAGLRGQHAASRFEAALTNQYTKVERAYAARLADLSDQFAVLERQTRAALAGSAAARESVQHTLVELHRLLTHLLHFALLNYKGFARIQQKYDARFGPTGAPTPLGCQLHAFAFADATQCHALLAQVERKFADLFCDGNRTLAAAAIMTRREDTIDWAPVYTGLKAGACLLLLVWVVWDSLVVPYFPTERGRHAIDLTLSRAFPVYRGVGCCLLLHWLLGLSMYVWRDAHINYRYLFRLHARSTPSVAEVVNDATNMSIVYLVNMLLYYKVVNGNFPEQLLHRGYYPLALFVYTVYFYVVRQWRRQLGLLRTLLEIMGSPFFPVTFFHVFVGNYLASLVKVNQDLAWSVCFFATNEFLLNDRVDARAAPASACQTNPLYANVAVPLICALPLWWRFLQNLRRIHDTKQWWPHLPNALKYALAQVVVLFGLFHPFYRTSRGASKVGDAVAFDVFQVTWIALFTLSSLYSWAWDVWMDWGLGRPQYQFLGDRQMFSRVWVYYAAIVADFFLCLAWTVSLVPPSSSPLLPAFLHPVTMVLELFRRTFWGFFMLENEHLRNTQGFRRVAFIPLDCDDIAKETTAIAPLQGRVFVLKILSIPMLVGALSVLAIVVQN